MTGKNEEDCPEYTQSCPSIHLVTLAPRRAFRRKLTLAVIPALEATIIETKDMGTRGSVTDVSNSDLHSIIVSIHAYQTTMCSNKQQSSIVTE